MKRLRIGIVTTWFERGAAYVSRAYMDTLKQRHDVFIYARGGEKYAEDNPNWRVDNLTWGRRRPYKFPTYIDWPDFKNWVSANRLDVILFNEQQSWEIIFRTVRELDVVIGSYVDYYKKESVRFFGLFDFLLCNTQRHYSVFKDHPNAFHIPWGTDTEVFSPRPREEDFDGVVFFHSCGMGPIRKGTDILVRAFAKVHGAAKLVVHTQADPLEYPDTVLAMERDPRIELVKAEIGPPGLYYRGDVYVYPTRLEGIGLTMAEALACGLPVITTDSPPMSEFVIDGRNGLLVEVEALKTRADNYYWPMSICDEDALAAAMQRFVDDPQSVAEFRRRAREDAVARLDWKKNSAALPELIAGVKKLDKDVSPELERAARAYERTIYPKPWWLFPVRVFLLRHGGRALQKAIKRMRMKGSG